MEGVIKFDLRFTPAPPLPHENVRELNAWRTLLRRLGLVGKDPNRYGGFGFGNLSRRLEPFEAPPGERRFVITGTQTGGVDELGPEGYALVLQCTPRDNRVIAQGPIRPSAEALTHATLYDLDPDLRWVMHVHSPEIWRKAAALDLPRTSEGAAYGSSELAFEIHDLLSDPTVFDRRILSVTGHEDGIFTFGRSAEEAGTVILHHLARAMICD